MRAVMQHTSRDALGVGVLRRLGKYEVVGAAHKCTPAGMPITLS